MPDGRRLLSRRDITLSGLVITAFAAGPAEANRYLDTSTDVLPRQGGRRGVQSPQPATRRGVAGGEAGTLKETFGAPRTADTDGKAPLERRPPVAPRGGGAPALQGTRVTPGGAPPPCPSASSKCW